MTTCTVHDCGKHVLARGYCSKHYNAWRTHGDPLKRALIERGSHKKWLISACETETDECIVWPFKSQYRKGYGMTWFRGKPIGVHRAVCIIVHGEPAPGMESAHSCGNNKCANPRHVRWATPTENNADKLIHGTQRRGEESPVAKLTDNDVRAILHLLDGGHTHLSIAGKFGVCRELISQISQGKIWKHIERRAA